MKHLAASLALWMSLGCSADAASPERVFVVNTGDTTVSLVDLGTLEELERFEVGKEPYGVAVSHDGKTVAVGVEGEGAVKFFDAESFAQKGVVSIGAMHHDHIAVTPDGKELLVANFYSDSVVMIDLATMRESARIEGTSAPHVVKYAPDRKRAFVTCKKITGVAVVDPAKRELLAFHQTKVNPRGLSFSPDGAKVYFGSFWVDGFFEMDAASGEVNRLFALPVPEGSERLEVTYHGVESVGPNTVLAANEGRSWVDSVDTQSGTLLDRLENGAKPCCIETIPGRAGEPARVLVSHIGNATIEVVEVSDTGQLESIGKVEVGAAPKHVAFVPEVPAQ